MRRTDLQITGPVARYAVRLDAKCDESVGHEHNFDHATFVMAGRVRVSRSRREGDRLVPLDATEHDAGAVVAIPAGVHHTIKALSDGAWYYCVFSHRDFNGLVVEKYDQHCVPAAYGLKPGCCDDLAPALPADLLAPVTAGA